MAQRIVLFSLGVIAVALLVLGISWKWLHPPESYWSQEQAQAYTDAFVAVHAAEDSALSGPGAAQFLAARQRFDALKNELDEARSARNRTGTYLAIAGLALLAAVCYFWQFSTPWSREKEN